MIIVETEESYQVMALRAEFAPPSMSSYHHHHQNLHIPWKESEGSARLCGWIVGFMERRMWLLFQYVVGIAWRSNEWELILVVEELQTRLTPVDLILHGHGDGKNYPSGLNDVEVGEEEAPVSLKFFSPPDMSWYLFDQERRKSSFVLIFCYVLWLCRRTKTTELFAQVVITCYFFLFVLNEF